MFKLNYTLKINNLNSKTLKYTPLTNLTLLNLITNNIHIKLIKKHTKVKTLILSPFHYKTSKKNIIRKTQSLIMYFNDCSINPYTKELIFYLIKNNKINTKVLEILPIIKTKLYF